MLYLIGLGLNIKGISKEGLEAVKRCKRVYLENYTVNFPYALADVIKLIKKNVKQLERKDVESLKIIDEAKKMDIALLVYGDPLVATTHLSLIQEAIKCNVKYQVIHSASILDGISETGLQIYKFGKIASMPKWDLSKNFQPTSFIEIIKENKLINAHSLILIDIDLNFQDALNQLIVSSKKHNLKINKILVCQMIGTRKKKISYKTIEELKKYYGVKAPYCIVIPSKLHFIEKEFLENL